MNADFESVYEAHMRDVHRFVWRFVQDAAVADELTHDVFLRAYQAWESFRNEAPEIIWLLRIARNACLDYLRSPRSRSRTVATLDEAKVLAEGSRVGVEGAAVAGKEPPLSVERAAQQAEMSECVQQFVLSLPESLRSPLILHDMEGLTNAEIAQVLGCSLEAAKMRLHRGRARLRQMMEERCDLFRDERNVLSCLPTERSLIGGEETGFVPIAQIDVLQTP